jgi:demethylmenaquinone methyltransferase/2-methoxy-6-polyprenyl-1,4-benzoquinol methylase
MLRADSTYAQTNPMATTQGARPEQGVAREQQVRTIFSEIAPRYDLLNHVLSLNIDRRWRKKAVAEVQQGLGQMAGGDTCRAPSSLRVLDACAGTYDLSLELLRAKGFEGRVVASDFAAPMLVAGKGKLGATPIDPLCADTLRLPFADASFDAAMVAFGVRNLSDVDAGFREFARVLRPGGRLVVLEFTTPPNPILRHGYLFYFHKILPIIGRIVSGHPWAYTYLPESVKEFPGPDALAEKLRTAGFTTARWRFVSGGIAAIHVGVR